MEATGWNGIGAPKGTPVEILDLLNKEINAALADPKMKSRLADLGGSLVRSLPCPPVDLAHSLRQLLGMQTAAAFGAAVDQACGTNVALGPAVANALPPCLTASP